MLTLIKGVFRRRQALNETSEKVEGTVDETSEQVEATPEQLEATLNEISEKIEATRPMTQLTHAVAQVLLGPRRNACDLALLTPDIVFLLAEVLPIADPVCLALSSRFFFKLLRSRLPLLNLPENVGQRVSF